MEIQEDSLLAGEYLDSVTIVDVSYDSSVDNVTDVYGRMVDTKDMI